MSKIGYKQSPEHKAKIGLANKGKKKPPFSDEHRKKIGNGSRGRKHSPETRKKIGKRGENHWNWQGGLKPIHERIRNSVEYKLWREAVFKRDNYTCVFCKEVGGNLQADHIKQFALYPELRFAIDNGRTLCVDCHRKTDTWGYKKPYLGK